MQGAGPRKRVDGKKGVTWPRKRVVYSVKGLSEGIDIMTDEAIINLFFARDHQAVAELSGKYGPACLKLSRGILGDLRDAEECVNDAYLAVWDTVPPQRPQPLLTYLCRIVRNLSVKRYHTNTAAKRNSTYDAALDELELCVPAPSTVEDEFAAGELSALLDRFLGTLKQDDRVLFVRRYWYADSVGELAARFHITSHNTTVRLARIRDRLRLYLKKEGYQL